MPRADVRWGDGRQRLRQAADRQPVPAIPERRGEGELERKAEHVVRHPLRLGDHQAPLGFDVGIGEMRLE